MRHYQIRIGNSDTYDTDDLEHAKAIAAEANLDKPITLWDNRKGEAINGTTCSPGCPDCHHRNTSPNWP